MDSYKVVNINAEGTLVGLRDAKGANHIAKLAIPSLRLDDHIDGDAARPGMHLFMSKDCTRIHRLTMVQVNCA